MSVKCPNCNTENISESKYCKECATPLPLPEGISVSQTKTYITPADVLIRGTIFADRYEIIEELETTNTSERAGRAQDKEDAYTMQKLRALGYM